jgi:hypothetical protein
MPVQAGGGGGGSGAATISGRPDAVKLSPKQVVASVPKPRFYWNSFIWSTPSKKIATAATKKSAKNECHYTTHGSWPLTSSDNLEFYYSAKGSGLTDEQVRSSLEEGYLVWKKAAPKLPSLKLTKIPEDERERMTGSSSMKGRHDRRNEILFVDVQHVNAASDNHWFAHVDVGRDREKPGAIVEVDILFDSVDGMKDEEHQWTTDGGAAGHDLRSVAVSMFGTALGMGLSQSPDHSMHGMSAKGETHKHTLECGDVSGIQSLYA